MLGTVSSYASTLANDQFQSKRSTRYVNLSCIVGDEAGPLSNAVVEIYLGETLFDALHANKNGAFKFRLPVNSKYVIKVSCEGYFSKSISFDAKYYRAGKAPDFDFAVELYAKAKFPLLEDNEILKLHAGIVIYSSKRKKFVFDKAYSRDLRFNYSTLMNAAENENRLSQANPR